MKKIILLFMLAGTVNAFSQDAADTAKLWKTEGNFTLLFSQSSFTNWSAGGENSIATNVGLRYAANYARGKAFWNNSIELGYGLTKQGSSSFRKNDDKIDLTTNYGYNAVKKWYYSALVNFKSQFSDGYDYANDPEGIMISGFLAPAYIIASLGMDYKPTDNFSLFLSPATAKFTIVNDDSLSMAGAFGVDPGDDFRSEIGGFVKAILKQPLMKNVSMLTKLELFSNYLNNPQNIDVNWQLAIDMKINKYLTANLGTELIYDDDIAIEYEPGRIGARTQFKQVFGAGLTLGF